MYRLLFSITMLTSLSAMAQDMADNDLRIQLTPHQSAVMAAGMSGTVKHIHVKDGDMVKKGQKLVEFECSRERSNINRTRARVSKQQKTLSTNQRLQKLGSVSKLELGISESELAEARAEYNIATATVKFCAVNAPFSGRVADVPTKAHQYVQEGTELIEVVDDSTLELQVIVPSKWLTWLKKGREFPVTIDELNSEFNASVTRIGGKVDPVTQSVRIYAELQAPSPYLRAGMSGTAKIVPSEQEDTPINGDE